MLPSIFVVRIKTLFLKLVGHSGSRRKMVSLQDSLFNFHVSEAKTEQHIVSQLLRKL